MKLGVAVHSNVVRRKRGGVQSLGIESKTPGLSSQWLYHGICAEWLLTVVIVLMHVHVSIVFLEAHCSLAPSPLPGAPQL